MIKSKTKINKINSVFTRLKFNQGFRDGTQFWATGTPDDGNDFVYWFAEYDNQTGKFKKRFVSDVFLGGFHEGFDIDSNQNLYVLSGQGPLYKLNYFDFSLEILLMETSNILGFALNEENNEVWIAAGQNLIKIYDMQTGEFISQHSYDTDSSGANYVLENENIYTIVNVIADKLQVSSINVNTKETGVSNDLLAGRPVTFVTFQSFFVKDGFFYSVWSENDSNEQIYMGRWDLATFNNEWILLLPQTFEDSTPTTEIIMDNDNRLYYSWDFGVGTSRVACLQLDNAGQNPELLWENDNVLSGSFGSVATEEMSVEKEPSGFLFVLHAVGAGISVLNKLTGEKVIGTQPSPPRSNFMTIIPFTDSDQVGLRQMRLSSEDWEMFIPGTEDIVRPATGYVNNGLTFDDPFNITEFDNNRYLRLAMLLFKSSRISGDTESIDLDLEVIKEYTDSTPDEIIYSGITSGQGLIFAPGIDDELELRIDTIIDLTNTKRIYLNITESSPVEFLPTDTFIIDLYADFDF